MIQPSLSLSPASFLLLTHKHIPTHTYTHLNVHSTHTLCQLTSVHTKLIPTQIHTFELGTHRHCTCTHLTRIQFEILRFPFKYPGDKERATTSSSDSPPPRVCLCPNSPHLQSTSALNIRPSRKYACLRFLPHSTDPVQLIFINLIWPKL